MNFCRTGKHAEHRGNLDCAAFVSERIEHSAQDHHPVLCRVNKLLAFNIDTQCMCRTSSRDRIVKSWQNLRCHTAALLCCLSCLLQLLVAR